MDLGHSLLNHAFDFLSCHLDTLVRIVSILAVLIENMLELFYIK